MLSHDSEAFGVLIRRVRGSKLGILVLFDMWRKMETVRTAYKDSRRPRTRVSNMIRKGVLCSFVRE